MANVNINTRIKLKYDTLANWTSNNPALLAGEIAVVEIPTGSSFEQTTPPAIVFKVGDGTSKFSALPYASALAADVYAWAKAAQKPTYTAGEVGAATVADITSAIEALDVANTGAVGKYPSSVSQVDGKIVVEWTTLPAADEYTLVAGATDGSVTLQKNGVAVSENVVVDGWEALVSSVAGKYVKPAGGIPKSDLASDVQTSLGKADTAVQSVAEGTTNGTIAVDGEDVPVHGLGSAAYTESSAYDTAGAATSAVGTHNTSGTAHSDIRALITALQGQVGDLGNALHFIGVEEELPESGETGDVVIVGDKEYVWANDTWNEFGSGDHLTKAQADGYYDAKGTAQTLINGLDATISGMGAGKTLATLTQTNGVIAATFQDIKISSANVTGLGALATEDTVGDAEITDVNMSKVTGLSSALAGKQDTLTFDGTYNGSTNKVATQSTVSNAIAALDKADSAQTNQYVTAVSEANGIISVTRKQIQYSEIAGTPTEKTTTFAAANGLTVSGADGGTVTYGIDLTSTFIFNCGNSSTLID